jgi:hypothetical protein
MNVDLRAFHIDWKTGKVTIDHGLHLLMPEPVEPPDMPEEIIEENDDDPR